MLIFSADNDVTFYGMYGYLAFHDCDPQKDMGFSVTVSTAGWTDIEDIEHMDACIRELEEKIGINCTSARTRLNMLRPQFD